MTETAQEEQERRDRVAMHIMQLAAHLRDGVPVEQLRSHYLQAMSPELFDEFLDAATSYNSVRSEEGLANFIKEEQAQRVTQEEKEAKKTQILIGLGIAALGAALSYASFDSVSESGGRYFLFYGAIISGIWIAIKGIFK